MTACRVSPRAGRKAEVRRHPHLDHRPFDATARDFAALLAGHGIELRAQVWRFPPSRRHLQFNWKSTAASQKPAGIDYLHFPELDGEASLCQYYRIRAGAKTVFAATPITCGSRNSGPTSRDCQRPHKSVGDEIIRIIDRGRGEDHPHTKCARIAGGARPYTADSTIQSQSDFQRSLDMGLFNGPPLIDPIEKLVGRKRLRDEVTLRLVAAELLEEIPVLSRLHAFRHHRQSEPVREFHA